MPSSRPWSFDAPGAAFKLAAEAWRIDMAWLFDPMMAVHSSNVEPLPHQITAVYEAMLPRQPLRYVLADDPGAGKTIMAGLFMRELMLRADAQRVLIVAPGSLVEQWQDELLEKFGLPFTLLAREPIEQAPGGKPFDAADLLVARLDQLARNPDLLEKLAASRWDLVVVDEAHKLSASYFGHQIKKTKRFLLGELLGSITRHFLLMTATPHNGKEEDFQLFLSLLDTDRFYGKFRDGAHKVDVGDLMRRMVKEEMLRFDGTHLFPERCAYTVNYPLSDAEAALYAAVTDYVRTEFARADQLADGGRKGTVGFALTTLQRRLASSPAAIYQSLKRRRAKLARRLADERLHSRGQLLAATVFDTGIDDPWDAAEDMPAEDYETLEDTLLDQASAAQTSAELEAEIGILTGLEQQARALVHASTDRKWDELARLLQDAPEIHDEIHDTQGQPRKLILFTEHRDTLDYLARRIGTLIGRTDAVVLIHGGIQRAERRRVQERFRHDPTVRILIATDAAGEGVNLQNANLMVNYDLPWNPNRLEQRFGRIHRIGQTQVCHLWNMVAAQTREGAVFQRLFDKLEVERAALGGRVFDILGEVFEASPLKDLLIEAIRYGADPVVRARLHDTVATALDPQHVRGILARHALCAEVMDARRLFAVKEEMEKAQARKLQPFFIRAFFLQAFQALGGSLHKREPGRYEISHVPAAIRARDRRIAGRDRRHPQTVLPRYERVCFDKQHVRVIGDASAPMASLLHPGHPLMQATTDLILEQHRAKLQHGALLLAPGDPGVEPRVLCLIDHAVTEGANPARLVSRRMQFVSITAHGQTVGAGWAPHLDLQALAPGERALVEDVRTAPWIAPNLEHTALAYASQHLAPAHLTEVRARREQAVDTTLAAVHERLVREISFQSDRYSKLKDDLAAGKDVRLNLDHVSRTIAELKARLAARTQALQAERHVVSATPVVVGAALVIPAGLLAQRQGSPGWSADAAARARVERRAMQAVIAAEEALGHTVIDVSSEHCGWDLTSVPPAVDGVLPRARHIEVKGRAKGQAFITVTRNEILYALNQAEQFLLAIVLVDGETSEGPFYVKNPFTQEPDWAAVSVNLNLQQLLDHAVPAAQTLCPTPRPPVGEGKNTP